MSEIMHAKRFESAGAIGMPTEIKCISHFNFDRYIPFDRSHSEDAGGGRIKYNFTHLLIIVTSAISEKILSISGEDETQRS